MILIYSFLKADSSCYLDGEMDDYCVLASQIPQQIKKFMSKETGVHRRILGEYGEPSTKGMERLQLPDKLSSRTFHQYKDSYRLWVTFHNSATGMDL
jgi:hypothetical protein